MPHIHCDMDISGLIFCAALYQHWLVCAQVKRYHLHMHAHAHTHTHTHTLTYTHSQARPWAKTSSRCLSSKRARTSFCPLKSPSRKLDTFKFYTATLHLRARLPRLQVCGEGGVCELEFYIFRMLLLHLTAQLPRLQVCSEGGGALEK